MAWGGRINLRASGRTDKTSRYTFMLCNECYECIKLAKVEWLPMTRCKDPVCYEKWLIAFKVITEGQTTRGHVDAISLSLHMQQAVKFPTLFISRGDYLSLQTNSSDYPVLKWEFIQVTCSRAHSMSVLRLISKLTFTSHPVPDRDNRL
jgi:hypothetical protein